MALEGIIYWPKQLSDDMFWLSEVPKKNNNNQFLWKWFWGEWITEQNS